MAWHKNWFSNMLPMDKPLVYQGITYKTVENFYQAMKLENSNLAGRLSIALMNPYQAKKAIRERLLYPWRKNWNRKNALEVMRYALEYKFAPGTSWAEKLLATGDEEIVEWNNWNDTFWGKCLKTKEGENHLGIILMEIRNKLK